MTAPDTSRSLTAMLPSSSAGPLLARLLVGLALVIGLAAAPAASYADPERPDLPDRAAEQAVEALEQAEAALAGAPGLEPTLALAQLATVVEDLPPAERQQAQAMFARPNDEKGDPFLHYPHSRKGAVHCTEHTCIHYLRKGQHAPPGEDADGDNVPDWVDRTGRVMETVWRAQVDEMGYDRPPGDGERGNQGGEERPDLLDVYLGDIGGQGVYGVTVTDPGTNIPYLVLDNDYAEFPGRPLGLLRVTAAHEAFHAVQFGYDVDEDPWLMEATAAWIEDEIYDAVNDSRQFLSESSLLHPKRSLDHPRAWYGNWIFFRFLTEQHDPDLVQEIWEHSRNAYSVKAINRALRGRGTNLAEAYARFSSLNNLPQRTYEEGGAYPSPKVAERHVLRPRTTRTGVRDARIRHLSARNVVLVSRKLAGRWRLRIHVDGPSTVARAQVIVHRRNGSVGLRRVDLDGQGDGRIRVPFGSAVRKVTLTLVNTSQAYRCNTGEWFACQGSPRRDRRAFSFRARAVR